MSSTDNQTGGGSDPWARYAQSMVAAKTDEQFFRMAAHEDGVLTDEETDQQPGMCQCENPTGHTLAIEDGSITITHTACGKKPWFMHDDSIECVSMDPVPVEVDVAVCSPNSHYYEYGICDCGPEITLSLGGE